MIGLHPVSQRVFTLLQIISKIFAVDMGYLSVTQFEP